MGAGPATFIHALSVQILVGDEVAIVTHMTDPGHDRQIGGKLPRDIHARHAIFRPHVDDRPRVRGEANARIVLMVIVDRQAILTVFVSLDIHVGYDGRLSGHRLNDVGVKT